MTVEAVLDVRQPDMIGLAVGVGLDEMAAAVIAAIDQHVTDARGAHLAGYVMTGGIVPWDIVLRGNST